jgi:hypothetical protein
MQWVMLIRSTLVNKWAGKLSVLDPNVNSVYNKDIYRLKLDRDFLVDQQDFLNNFSSAYIASKRDKHNYYSDYYLLNFPPKCKNSVYLKFQVKEEGWFDFCIKQFDDYKIPLSEKSKANF